MAVIANMTGNTATGANYTSIAHDYITEWQILGIAHDADPPHTTLAYGMNDTHGIPIPSIEVRLIHKLKLLKGCCTISLAIGSSA